MRRSWKARAVSRRWTHEFALAAVLALGLAVSACGEDEGAGGSGGGSSSEEGPAKVAFLVATEAAGYPQGMLKAARAAAGQENVELEVFDAQFDPRKQVAQCQDAVASGSFDAIVALSAASPPMVACARAAEAKEIPLIATSTPIGTEIAKGEPTVPGVTAQVLVPPVTVSDTGLRELLPKLCEQVERPCKVGFIEGVRALVITSIAEKAVKGIVKENAGDMELVGACEGGYQRQGGLKCMQDLLQKDPDVNVLLSMSDDMALGAEGALRKAGKTPGEDIFVGTQGGSVQGMERIRDGRWYGTVVAPAAAEGRVPIELAAKAARGEQVPGWVNPLEAAELPLVLDQQNKEEHPDFAGQFEA